MKTTAATDSYVNAEDLTATIESAAVANPMAIDQSSAETATIPSENDNSSTNRATMENLDGSVPAPNDHGNELTNPNQNPTPPIIQEAMTGDRRQQPPSTAIASTPSAASATFTFNNNSSWTGQTIAADGPFQQPPSLSIMTNATRSPSKLVSARAFDSPDPAAMATASFESSRNNSNDEISAKGYPYPTMTPMIPPVFASLTTTSDDLPPTGTTPSLPPPMHPGMMFLGHNTTSNATDQQPLPYHQPHLSTPGGVEGGPAAFFTPNGNTAMLGYNAMEDYALPSTLQSDYLDSTYFQHQPHMHPGAPPSLALTVSNINAGQRPMPAFTASGDGDDGTTTGTPPMPPLVIALAAQEAATAAAQIVANATAIEQAEAEAADENKEEEKEATPTTDNSAGGKKRSSTETSKTNKSKKKKARALPTAANRKPPTKASSGRFGSSRVSETGTARAFTDAELAAIKCKCTKSKCLKLYCDCFQSGSVCKDSCSCVRCGNTEGSAARAKAQKQILQRRPDAFMLRAMDTENGCKCKKNKCLKKYCGCFASGMLCGDLCICANCENRGDEAGANCSAKAKKMSTSRKTKHVTPLSSTRPPAQAAAESSILLEAASSDFADPPPLVLNETPAFNFESV